MSEGDVTDLISPKEKDTQLTYIAPEPYLSLRLWTTLASFKNVKSAMSSTRSNLGGFILNKASNGTLLI